MPCWSVVSRDINGERGDALRIAYQNRPRLFDRHIVLPKLLYSRVIEAQERVGAHGEVIEPLDEEHLKERLWAAYDAGLRSVAILPLGYRADEGDWLVNLKKVRRPREQFVTNV